MRSELWAFVIHAAIAKKWNAGTHIYDNNYKYVVESRVLERN